MNRVHSASKDLVNSHVAPALPYWIAGALTGIVASGFAALFRVLTNQSLHLFEKHTMVWAALVPVSFLISFLLVNRMAPGAAGSGIPQVMAAIEHFEEGSPEWLRRLLGLRMVIVKVFSSSVMIAGGGAIGREGPTIQIGASIFIWTEDLFTKFGFVTRKDSVASRKAFILAGGAAGIAAAFNTPLGGIVFAIEELATVAFKQFRTTVITGVIVAGITAQTIVGPYLYLGQPTLGKMGWLSTAASLGVGIFAGLAGGVFGRSLFSLVRVRARLKSLSSQVSLILGLSVLFVALAYFSRGTSIGSGAEGIGGLLFHNQPVSFLDAPIRFIASQISYMVAGAGGIFAPALSVGANLGAWVASVIPALSGDSNLLIMVGMAAFLTGVTHAPFTSLVLVIEMTDKSNAIFPLMLGTMAALSAAHVVDHLSFYERMKERFLPEGPLRSVSSEHP